MLIVKKFGGSSVANKERIFNVAKRCIEDYRAGHDVVVVLSAMGDTTDDLIALANTINPNAKKRELDMLLTTGEHGYGNAGTGCAGSIFECFSGYDAFHIPLWKCQI